MSKEDVREAILDATEKVIRERGLTETKIEDIAKEAGVSKGGIFFHFSSKKSLLLGVVERYEEILYALRDDIYEELPPQPSRIMKATIMALMEHPKRLGDNIFTMLADKEIRDAVGVIKKKVTDEMLADTEDPKTAATALLIFEGLCFTDMFEKDIISREMVGDIACDIATSLDISCYEWALTLPAYVTIRPWVAPGVAAGRE